MDDDEIKSLEANVLLSEFRIAAEPFDEEVAGGDGSTHVRVYFTEPVHAIEIWALRAHKKDFTGSDEQTHDDQNQNIQLAERRRMNWLNDENAYHVG